jgi:hypothetical protein
MKHVLRQRREYTASGSLEQSRRADARKLDPDPLKALRGLGYIED